MDAATYRPYPTYPVIPPNPTLDEIGSAVLRYVISERSTSSIPTEQLEQADRFGAIAVAGYGKDGSPALEGIQEARRMVAVTLRHRRAEEAKLEALQASTPAELPTPEPGGDDQPQLTDEQLIAQMFKEMMRLTRGLGKDKDNPDGGKKSKLIKPKPMLPSGGVALDSRPS